MIKLRDIYRLLGPQFLHLQNGATIVILIVIVIEIVNFTKNALGFYEV